MWKKHIELKLSGLDVVSMFLGKIVLGLLFTLGLFYVCSCIAKKLLTLLIVIYPVAWKHWSFIVIIGLILLGIRELIAFINQHLCIIKINGKRYFLRRKFCWEMKPKQKIN